MKKVIIYPGRFQPMLPHHAEVFRKLQAEHTDAEVFIATANKVEPGKSPFDAQEKLSIMTQQHDIPQDRIIIAAGNNLYNKDSYIDAFSPAEEHSLFFAVGEKDMQSGDARFQFKPLKDGSKSYLQNGEDVINTNNAQPMVRHGYVIQAPNVPGISGDVASASAFRSALLSAPDLDSAKETYTSYMGEFNQEIFNLVYDKITGKIMKENLDILKKLAGLLDEAPVNFKPGKGGMDYEPGISKKDLKAAAERPEKAAASNPASVGFTKIAPEDMISVDTGKPINSRQRARSMANQFPDGADVNDPAVKKEMFLKLLAQSPGYVLGEINARLANDEEGFAVSDRLSAIVDNLPEGGIMGLGDADRKWTIELVNNAINNMELHRKDSELDKFDDLEAEPEPEVDMDEPEMVSLDDPEFDAPEDELEMEAKKDEPKNCGCGKNPCETYGNPEEAIEEANPNLEVQSIKNNKGEEIKFTVLNGEPFDVNGAPLEYGQYWDIVRTEYSDIATNDMWSDYEKRHKGMKGYNENESMQELRKLAGLNEGGECYQCDGADEDCPQCNGSGYVQYDDDGREPSDDEIQAHADAYEIYKKHRDSKKESVTENVDLATVIEEIIGEDDYDNKYDNEPTVGQMSFDDLCDYCGVTPEECEMDMKEYYQVQDVTDEVKEKYRQDVLIPCANEVSMDHAEYESKELDEFQEPEPDFGEPDDQYKLVDKAGVEIKMLQEVPGLMRPNQFISVSPPTGDQPAFAMIKDAKGKINKVTQDRLAEIGLKIVGSGPKGQQELNLPMPDSGPTQGELNLKGGYNLRRKEESVDQAIENALDETVEELKKLAGL
jgi:hypothetical protein